MTDVPTAEPAAGPPDFLTVYREHAGFVWRVLRSLGVPNATVADAAQEVFVVVHRRLPDFDARHAISTWLFAIAYRVASNHRRSQRRNRASEPLPEHVLDAGPDPHERVERREAERLALWLLDQLDEDKRMLIVLADIEQRTVPEIATLTGKPLNTVYTQLRRARQEFSGALAAHEQRRRP